MANMIMLYRQLWAHYSCLVTDQRVYMTFEPCGRLPREHTTTTKLICQLVGHHSASS